MENPSKTINIVDSYYNTRFVMNFHRKLNLGLSWKFGIRAWIRKTAKMISQQILRPKRNDYFNRVIRLSNILKATFIVSKKNVQEVGQITKYCRKISNKLDKLVNFVTKIRTSFGLICALFPEFFWDWKAVSAIFWWFSNVCRL